MSLQKAFISGATGFLGYALAKNLRARGVSTVALTRNGELPGDLTESGVEAVRGDLSDAPQLAELLAGCDVVFHVAADVGMWKGRWTEAYATNVLGTEALVDAALLAGTTRFVLTSSASTLGKPWQSPPNEVVTIDETTIYNLAPLGMVYPHTKWLSEQVVLRAMNRGLRPTITHPTAIFGPCDWKRNLLPLFQATKGFAGKMVPRGMRTTCDVRDVAEAHVRLAELNEAGERYALGGEVLSVRELFTKIAEVSGGSPPQLELSDGLMMGIGKAMDALACLTGKAPKVSEEMARQATFRVAVSSAKAERLIDYKSRPLDESLADTAAWYRRQGWL